MQEKSTIENIQFEIESGLADLAEKMQKFNDEAADWDDDNQKVSFDASGSDWIMVRWKWRIAVPRSLMNLF